MEAFSQKLSRKVTYEIHLINFSVFLKFRSHRNMLMFDSFMTLWNRNSALSKACQLDAQSDWLISSSCISRIPSCQASGRIRRPRGLWTRIQSAGPWGDPSTRGRGHSVQVGGSRDPPPGVWCGLIEQGVMKIARLKVGVGENLHRLEWTRCIDLKGKTQFKIIQNIKVSQMQQNIIFFSFLKENGTICKK